MSKNPYEESKFAKFSRGKTFYAALAVFLIAAGATGAFFLTEEEPLTEIEKPESPQLEVREKFEPEVPKLEEIYSPEIKKPEIEEKEEEKEEKPVPIEASSIVTKGFMPCQGEIISPFSKGELVKDETMGDWRTHNGIDIKAPEGKEVKAFMSGKVKNVRNDSLWGTVIEIQHKDAIISKYCGLDENVNVNEGDSVKAGDEIGKVGFIPSESAKESHLHFEVTEKGKYKDPLEFIG